MYFESVLRESGGRFFVRLHASTNLRALLRDAVNGRLELGPLNRTLDLKGITRADNRSVELDIIFGFATAKI